MKGISLIMPDIKKEDRKKFNPVIKKIVSILNKPDKISPGELNYLISKSLYQLFDAKPSYTLGNDLIGMLECVKLEFYRRRLANYEDKKIEENGDI